MSPFSRYKGTSVIRRPYGASIAKRNEFNEEFLSRRLSGDVAELEPQVNAVTRETPNMDQSARHEYSWGVRLAVFLAAISVSLLLFLGFAWYLASSEANAQLALLRQKGMPTNGSELKEFNKIPAGTPDATEAWTQAIEAVDAADLYKRGRAIPVFGSSRTDIPPPGTDWAELNASRAFLNELEPELQLVRQAAQTPGEVCFKWDYSAGVMAALPAISATRDVADLLLLDAHVHAHDGNNGLALQDLCQIFALSDALQKEPCIFGQALRFGILSVGCTGFTKLLNYGQWTDRELVTLQSAIASTDFKAGMQNAVIGERAFCLDALSQFSMGPLLPTNQSEILSIFEQSMENISEPWPVPLHRQTELEQQVAITSAKPFSSVFRNFSPMVAMTTPGLIINAARAIARQRTTILAIAAQRFRLQHGKYPETLADIPQELLPSDPANELRTDPFNGRSLVLKSDGTQLMIYSVGEDTKDDGGNFSDIDYELPTDIGIRLVP